jgi:hypothetical protein
VSDSDAALGCGYHFGSQHTHTQTNVSTGLRLPLWLPSHCFYRTCTLRVMHTSCTPREHLVPLSSTPRPLSLSLSLSCVCARARARASSLSKNQTRDEEEDEAHNAEDAARDPYVERYLSTHSHTHTFGPR